MILSLTLKFWIYIHASSIDGSHNLEIKADIGETSRKIDIIDELPVLEILGKHVSFEYEIMEGSMEIDANLSGDLFKGKLDQDGETYTQYFQMGTLLSFQNNCLIKCAGDCAHQTTKLSFP